MFSKSEKKRLVLRWLFMWEVSKILQLIWLQFKEESFFTIGRGGGSRPLRVKESQKVVLKLRQSKVLRYTT